MENRIESFNNERYQQLKIKVQLDIELHKSTPYDFMITYEQAIIKEDYEYDKAITDVLLPLGLKTSDTHKYIKTLF